MRRLDRSRMSTTWWGLIGLALGLAGVAAIFVAPKLTSQTPFELQAVFRSDAQLRTGSPVRIAGVEAGRVTGVRPVAPGSDAAVVSMRLREGALPLHSDATARIRSRLILEGNFYVELRPGSPGARLVRSGHTIPVGRTTGPVQLDRVLTDLQLATRNDLATTLQGFGQAVGGTAGGESAGRALNRSLEDWPEALRGVRDVTGALRGEGPRDLSRTVRATQAAFEGLADSDNALGELVIGLDATMAATASRRTQLRSSLAQLPGVLDGARSTLTRLDRALPSTRRFALALRPGLRELPATITAALPWLRENRRLLAASELGGLVEDLAPTARDSAATVAALRPFVAQLDDLDRCLTQTLVPTGDQVISEPPFSSGSSVSQEFFASFVGLASLGQNFDGNGHYLRGQTGGGATPIVTSRLGQQGIAYGNGALPPLGTRPAYPGRRPARRDGVKCASSSPPDLNAARTGRAP